MLNNAWSRFVSSSNWPTSSWTRAAHAHELMREAESEIEDALEDVRSLARGIYPSLLADQGLGEALRSAALRVPLFTTVECDGLVRYRPEVESAVYFSCLEALQNAVKHARGARSVGVSILTNGELRFEVRDDGEGFDTKSSLAGQGLMNIRDRLEAVGGRLTVHSVPGEGTVVRGTVPVESFVAAPAAGPSSPLVEGQLHRPFERPDRARWPTAPYRSGPARTRPAHRA